MEELDYLIKMHKEREAKINQITLALTKCASVDESLVKKMPDGSTQEVRKVTTPSGDNIFATSCDGKNVMHFTSLKQANDFLGR